MCACPFLTSGLNFATVIDEGVRAIKDMYDGVRAIVRSLVGDKEYFAIDIGLH